ncbi:MAG TPA: DNA gyrase subunit A [Candidatus Hydrothermia bacterium]|nr:DNA gyrase subunit A [Candidatus Hydrothermia bacterium]
MLENDERREIPTLIEEEIRSAYIDYAMSVIVGRALPDVRDGLKPVQRRILFSMREVGLLPSKPFRKSATVVGEVIGKYHPHGDQSVYDALVRLAQDFTMRYPLVEGQGNFGSIDGDPPAAYRYTEARLSPIAMELLDGLDEDAVDFVPNFDGRLKEPVVLPSRFPNILCNGSYGIAVGMATEIPPHNIGEVLEALVALIENPQISIEQLMHYIKGPDFPTGGIIIGSKGIRSAYSTGSGTITVRARAHVEEKQGGRLSLVFTEFPYRVSKASIIFKIASLAKGGVITEISEVRDESDREGLRLVVELKRGADPDVALNKLYKHTQLQETFGLNFLALVDNVPEVLDIKRILEEYLKYQEDVNTRVIKFRLGKKEERAHILEGFKIALEHLDEIIEIIKTSEDQGDAKEKLMGRFSLSELQSQAILDMRLGNLTKLDRDKVEREYENCVMEIARFREILSDRKLLLEEIKNQFMEIKKKYADHRKTEIVEEELTSFDAEELIPDEQVIVTVTLKNYIKRSSIASFRTQRRGGKGKKGIRTYTDDYPIAIILSSNHNNLLLFTNLGRCYVVKTYEIQEGGLQDKGVSLRRLINLKDEERVISAVSIRNDEFTKDKYLVFATSNGIVKRTPLSLFAKVGRPGRRAINLRENDTVVDVLVTSGDDELIIARDSGRAVKFSEKEITIHGVAAYGIRGIKLAKGERAVSMVKVSHNKEVLTITELGYGKRFLPSEITLHHRNTGGVKILSGIKKTGKLKKLAMVTEKDDIIILAKSGKVIRIKAAEINLQKRASMGTKLIDTIDGDLVVDCEIIPHQEGLEEEELF